MFNCSCDGAVHRTDENCFQREVKEAIATCKLKPSLKKVAGHYYLSAVCTKFIVTSLAMKKSGLDFQEATVTHTEFVGV